uniref:3-oxo-5alpha-steroid 4-dehydrogenase (NADP(+)) n=1 Tax=Salvator merianae TaxID=96440 RepID=A0A8D0C229_SALMN
DSPPPSRTMQCFPDLVVALSCGLVAFGALHLRSEMFKTLQYGKEEDRQEPGEEAGKESAKKPPRRHRVHLPTSCAWILMELPSIMVPTFLLVLRHPPRLAPLGCKLLGGMFCGHYFHRTFIYPFFRRGRPFPLHTVFAGILFCMFNGFLQSYYMIYCAEYPDDWCNDVRFTSGFLLFVLGMGINIHSDFLLRQLRKPGEFTYKIPQGGLFAYVSSANYFGEILEWFGYAIATWCLPAFAFAFCTVCILGPRACQCHRY